ncbi:MAG: helix-turn-helix domain-containing protein [Kordia sp.]|uniref:helix-turn-helix domain-containing protein n=1 Tax=Kordia sp. TaxID=1965332 RepID=UPI00385B4C62
MNLISLFLSIPNNYNHSPNMMPLLRFKPWNICITCVLLFCFTGIGFAQTSTSTSIDTISLQKSLQKMSFKDVVEEYYIQGRTSVAKARIVISYLRSNYITSKDENEVAETYITLASWQNRNYNLKEAVASLDIGIEKSERLGNIPLLYEAHKKRGVYLFFGGQNEPALESFLEAFELAKKMNSLKAQIESKNNIALVQLQVKDNLGAIDLYLENLQKIKESSDKSLEKKRATIYLGLTKAYINLDNHTEASSYANKGLALSKQAKNIAFQAYFSTFLGEIESNSGNYTKAHELFIKVKGLIDSAGGSKSLDMFLKLYIGRNYAAENKHDLAIKEFLEGQQLLKENETDYLSIQGLYIGLAESYSAVENIEESSKYYKKAHEIDAENDKTRAILNSRITKNKLGNLKEQITDLETKSKRTKYLYAIGIGLLLLTIVGLIVYYKKQQQKNKARFTNLMLQLEEKRQQERVPLEKNVKTTSAVHTKKSDSKANVIPEIDEKTAEILKKLEDFEAKELYLSNESTLVEVAKKIQTNTTYLSKVINTYKEKSFTAYITDLRVEYAIERLSVDRKFRSFTIGAIAQEIGFKRSESFSKAFKVKTGLYPSYFIKELEKQ